MIGFEIYIIHISIMFFVDCFKRMRKLFFEAFHRHVSLFSL